MALGDITYGSEYVYNAGSTQVNSLALLDSTHVVVAFMDYSNSRKGTACVGTISSSGIEWGTKVVFRDYYMARPNVCVLDSTHFAVISADAGGAFVRIGTVSSGTTITYGTAVQLSGSSPWELPCITTLDSTHFVASYNYSGDKILRTVVGTVSSGDSISLGTVEDGGKNYGNFCLTTIDSSRFIINFVNRSTSRGQSIIGTVSSGDSISLGTVYEFNGGWTSSSFARAYDSTHVVITYTDGGNSNYGTGIIGTITNGNELSFGSEYVFRSSASYSIHNTLLNSTKFVVSYRDDGNSSYGTNKIGTIADGAISYGNAFVYNTADPGFCPIVATDATHVVIAYTDAGNSSYGTGIIGTVDNTVPPTVITPDTISFKETLYAPDINPTVVTPSVVSIENTLFVPFIPTFVPNTIEIENSLLEPIIRPSVTITPDVIEIENTLNYVHINPTVVTPSVVSIENTLFEPIIPIVVDVIDIENSLLDPIIRPSVTITPSVVSIENTLIEPIIEIIKIVEAPLFSIESTLLEPIVRITPIITPSVINIDDTLFDPIIPIVVDVIEIENTLLEPIVKYGTTTIPDTIEIENTLLDPTIRTSAIITLSVINIENTLLEPKVDVGKKIQYGSNYQLDISNSYYNNVVSLDDTHFVNVYYNSNYGRANVGILSDIDEIAYGDDYQFIENSSLGINDLIKLDDSHFAFVYSITSPSYLSYVRIGTVTNDEIVFGDACNFHSNGSLETAALNRIDDTHFVVSYRDYVNNSYGTSIIFTVSNGDEISAGTKYIFNSSATQDVNSVTINSTKFVLTFNNASLIATVDGSTLSFGDQYTFDTVKIGSYGSIDLIDETHFVISYVDSSSNNYYGLNRIATINGNEITYNAKYVFESRRVFYIKTISRGDNRFIVTYKTGSPYPIHSRICDAATLDYSVSYELTNSSSSDIDTSLINFKSFVLLWYASSVLYNTIGVFDTILINVPLFEIENNLLEPIIRPSVTTFPDVIDIESTLFEPIIEIIKVVKAPLLNIENTLFEPIIPIIVDVIEIENSLLEPIIPIVVNVIEIESDLFEPIIKYGTTSFPDTIHISNSIMAPYIKYGCTTFPDTIDISILFIDPVVEGDISPPWTFEIGRQQSWFDPIWIFEIEEEVAATLFLNYDSGIWVMNFRSDYPLYTFGDFWGFDTYNTTKNYNIQNFTVRLSEYETEAYYPVNSIAELIPGTFYFDSVSQNLYVIFENYGRPEFISSFILGGALAYSNKAYYNQYGNYIPAINNISDITIEKDSTYYGVAKYNSKTISLINSVGDYSLDGFINDTVLYGRNANIKLGWYDEAHVAIPYNEFRLMFRGKVEAVPTISQDKISIKLNDARKFLTQPVVAGTYSATDYPNINDGEIDKPIPIIYGPMRGIECVCTNEEEEPIPTTYNFRFCTEATSISQVYVEGIKVTHSSFSTNGTFDLSSTDYEAGDEVTVDCVGINKTNGLEIIRELILNYEAKPFNSIYYDVAEWNYYEADAWDVSIRIEIETLIDAIELISNSLNGMFLITPDGRYSFRKTQWNDDIKRIITQSELLDHPDADYDANQLTSSVVCLFDRSYAKDSFKNALNNTYELDFYNEYKLKKRKEFETLINNRTDANAFTLERIEQLKELTPEFTINTTLQHCDLTMGDIVAVDIDRIDSRWFGRIKGEILSHSISPGSSEVSMKIKYITALSVNLDGGPSDVLLRTTIDCGPSNRTTTVFDYDGGNSL